MTTTSMYELLRGLDRLVFPPECLVCGQDFNREDDISICRECRTEIETDSRDACPRCCATVGPHTNLEGGCPSCRGESFHFESAIRLGPYDGKLRDAILKAKHATGEILAETLGILWARRDRERILAGRPDVVVPIPLHWLRRIERGYNQSAAIAVALASQLNLNPGTAWIRRVKATPKQYTQSATARRENLKGAFRASWRCRAKNLRVLLVDDVLTTGATANEAAKALKHAGAAQVSVAVLAHR